ncbi:protein FAM47A-like [Orycteropus afer afer]|uniref:Protein FAM47A-like n=1 Tax=Orycteropus afer afer TaxID=1230840 RepID=A0A8B7BDZ0_ORYAF|nr:protein FAM47A-like [Orycteropus afer afer]
MRCKPWYKDRLPSKCFAKSKDRPTFPTSLSYRSWVFVNKGLDNFRRGCPNHTEMITRAPTEAFLPLIYRTTPKPAPKSCRKKLSRKSALFSNLSPSQLARKAFMKDVDAHLKLHPLSFHQHLEEEMPVEVLLKVLGELDPDRKLEDTWAACQDVRKRREKPTALTQYYSTESCLSIPELTIMPTPEEWLEEIKEIIVDLPPSPLPQRTSRKLAQFFQWVASLGCTDFDEETIEPLFEIKFDEKPQFGPPKIKNILLVPEEIRYIKCRTKQLEPKFSLPEPDVTKKLYEIQCLRQKKHMKMRYGAWYLHPNLWKKLREDEPLLDPDAPDDSDSDDGYFRRPKKEYDILEDLYGTIAFKDFILNKGYSMPSVIERLFKRKGWRYDTVRTPKILSTRNSSREDSSEED